MEWALAALLVVHGLVHALGVAKAFGLAELTALTLPISRARGILWLVASVLSLFAAREILVGSVHAWAPMGASAITSQAAILGSWREAKYATIVNALVLGAAIFVAHGAR
ncbi:MAG: hypothetical protein U0234_17625 [Sandaracinus sp.]